MSDPFPDAEEHPLIAEGIEAAAVRVAVCAPEHARGLNPDRDLTVPILRAIARAALAVHARGEVWTTRELFRLEGVPYASAVEAYIAHELDDRELANPEAVRECRRLSKWRELRDHLMRAAVACEQQDMGTVLSALEVVNAMAPRAQTVRAA